MTSIEIIKTLARLYGIKNLEQSKQDLIQAIQKQEGYEACFATKGLQCPQQDCLWRSDCMHRPFVFEVKEK